MTLDDLGGILTRADERRRHFHLRRSLVPSGMDTEAMLEAAHADVERLVDELRANPADVVEARPGGCPFCGVPPVDVVLIEDADGELAYCKGCGARGPSCATESEAWAAWNRRPR